MNRTVFSIFLALCLLAAGLNIYGGFRYRVLQHGQEIARFLEDRGFEHGFGGYWDSSIVTLLSGNRVRTRALKFKEDGAAPYFWMARSQWYRPTVYRGKTFLIVPEGFDEADQENIISAYGFPKDSFRIENHVILTWPYNILRQSARTNLNDNPSMLTGGFVSGPGRPYRITQRGEKGLLSLASPLTLSRGSHRVVFELETDLMPGQTAGYVGIYTIDSLNKLLAQSPIIAGENVYELEFSTMDDKGYIPLVHVNGQSTVKLYDVLVERYR